MAELLHVHRQTVLKWERGQHRIPYPAYKLLRVLRCYELPETCWDGWEARDGALWSPAGHRFTPGELAWLSLTFRRAEQFTVVRRELEARRKKQRYIWAYARTSRSQDAALTRTRTYWVDGPFESFAERLRRTWSLVAEAPVKAELFNFSVAYLLLKPRRPIHCDPTCSWRDSSSQHSSKT